MYVGTEAVAGAPEAVRATVEGGTPVAYVTNNGSRRASEVAELLVSIGVPARPDEVLTSARAAAELLAADLADDTPVLVVGAPALREEIAAVGLRPVTDPDDRPAAVVQGYGPDVGWAELADATGGDPGRGPVGGHEHRCHAALAPGDRCRATAAWSRPSARRWADGNPTSWSASRTRPCSSWRPGHVGARRALVVGDRLDTDIDGARRAGMASLLVLTGVTGAADVLGAGTARTTDTHRGRLRGTVHTGGGQPGPGVAGRAGG